MSAVETEAAALVDSLVAELGRLNATANLAAWEAATTGSPEASERSAAARTAVRRLYSRAEPAARVRELLRSGEVRDALLRRQLTLLDLSFTGNQLPAEVIEDFSRREAELEQIFYHFRARVDGADLSDNALLEILRTERDSGRRREAWEASKRLGRLVAPPLLELVRRRNEAARGLGFRDFYAMELALQEIDEGDLFALLDDFRAQSERPFAELRAEMDTVLAKRFAVAEEELRSWHWEDLFSQEAPSLGTVDLDPVYRGKDLVEIGSAYFDGIGLPVADVLARSDLFEREGKDQHAFAMDVDREGDVRILCNLRDNEKWMGVLLHELGHAAYDKFLPRSLPYLLRSPAHTLTTEAVAMFMGRLTRIPAWLARVMNVPVDVATAGEIRRQLRTSMLVSARWILVMAYFERELYRDPDRADLNALWWDLVEDLQKVRRPEGRDEPDWAAKIHLSLAPVYYHSYLLGELMASQLTSAVRAAGGGDGALADPSVGAFFRERVFAPGATVAWNDLVRSATGEPLSARHFVRQFFAPAPS